jgi:hypothetical protein
MKNNLKAGDIIPAGSLIQYLNKLTLLMSDVVVIPNKTHLGLMFMSDFVVLTSFHGHLNWPTGNFSYISIDHIQIIYMHDGRPSS